MWSTVSKTLNISKDLNKTYFFILKPIPKRSDSKERTTLMAQRLGLKP